MSRARLPVSLLALAVVLPLSLLVAAPADAAVCPGTDGVTVVVQFPGGRIETGCAAGSPASGLAALSSAGFGYAFVPGQPGAVCTIKGAPSDGDCWKPPKTWSYWHAQRGGSWSFSNVGAGSYRPKPGSVEGWVFGTNARPGMAPPPAVKPTATPTTKPTVKPTAKPTVKPTAKPTKKPTTTATVKPTAKATGTPSAEPANAPTPDEAPAAGDTTETTQPATPSEPTESSPTTPVRDPSVSESSPAAAEVPVAPASVASDGGSGALSWVWGVGLVVLLVGGGVAAAIRRRKA